jgi:hypothetical protein
MALSQYGEDPRGPRRGAKESRGTPGPLGLAALLQTPGSPPFWTSRAFITTPDMAMAGI